MQPQGEQNYWQAPETTEQVSEPSQFAGYDLTDEPAHAGEPQMSPVSWQASEYIHHEKGVSWFVALLVGAAVLIGVAFFLIRSLTFAILICVMTAAAIVYARRPPRLLNYSLTAQGLQIDDNHYSYHDFRGFAVVQDGPLPSIVLLPVKRFMPAVTVYFPSENGEAIVDMFGSVLPMEHRKLDFVDNLVRKLRF